MSVRLLPLVVAALCSVATAHAQPAIRARLLGSGLNRPVALVQDPVDRRAMHLVQQNGVVRTFVDGVLRPTPFLDLSAVVSGGTDERGLLGMAFPPGAATSGRVFVNFTDQNSNTVVARFTRSAADPLVVDPASRFDLQWPATGGGRQGYIEQPFQNHNGGHLAFGPDGFLYIGLGDGGAGDDPFNNAQTPTTLLGKMLRIDIAVADNHAVGYTVPDDNPALVPGSPLPATTLPEIWAYGLRNPWRYSFDDFGPGATGALVIADVGQGAREEINYEPAGRAGNNYGWSVFEGSAVNPAGASAPAYQPVVSPTFEYTHSVGQVITGGYVYRGTALGDFYRGRYFYADCGSGRVWSLALTIGSLGDAVASDNREHTTTMGGPFQCISSFARDLAGELYFMTFDAAGGAGTGRVYRLELGATVPPAPNPPTDLHASVTGNSVSLSWTPPASGPAPAGYMLQAGYTSGGTEIGSFITTGTSLAFAGVPDGRYFVRVRSGNAAGVVSAPTPDAEIFVGCSAAPAAPTTFVASVTGTQVALTWNVEPGTTRTVLEVGYAPGATFLTYPVNAPAGGLVASGPPATYYARVRAVNACGQSAPSVERTIVIQ